MDLTLLLCNQSFYPSYIHQACSGRKIGIKLSSPLQDALASLVDLNVRSYIPFWAAYIPVVTVVVYKSWNVIIDQGHQHRESFISFTGVYCYQGSWLQFYYLSTSSLQQPFWNV